MHGFSSIEPDQDCVWRYPIKICLDTDIDYLLSLIRLKEMFQSAISGEN